MIKKTTAQLKKQLWELCKKIIRKRDGNICIICGKNDLSGSNWHTGHFIASSICGGFLRYDLRNLHSNCYNCNINCGGNGALYYVALQKKYGKKFVDKIIKDRQKIIKLDSLFLDEKIKEYDEIQNWDKNKLFNYTKNYGD